ncbi:hypothetical protein T439DRAFT_384219 [Meredithblackwellia eburnea MCA 4105]
MVQLGLGIILSGLVALSWGSPPIGATITSNSTYYHQLFPPPDPELSIPTYHTSLATLLPILPLLAPPPSHNLVVTFATQAFRPLFYNWLCYFKHKAKWGYPLHNSNPPPLGRDTPKFLTVTSDGELARELSENGLVVWFLEGVDLDDLDQDLTEVAGEGEGEEEEDRRVKEELLARRIQDDLFLNLRFLDLLLPPELNTTTTSSSSSTTTDPLRKSMIEWGSLRYQSLMLERSVVMSVLVGALVESQKVETEWREQEEREWDEAVKAHDWSESRLLKPEWVGVRGVLVVDNDAVWLQSPAPLLDHPYRPTGTHPSILFAPDSSPTFRNSWGGHSMPCACFLYTRTFDHLSHTASFPPPSPTFPSPSPDQHRPTTQAAQLWRHVALCHIAMLLRELSLAREQARKLFETSLNLSSLKRARAPSFQATVLGPAIGDVDDLLNLLEEAGLGTETGTTCLEIAKRNHQLSPNPTPSLGTMLKPNQLPFPANSD